MIKKIKIPAIIIYILSVMLLGFSVNLYAKIGWGISTISSVPYTIFEITGWLTVGAMVTCIQAILLILEVVILKRLTASMLLTFVTAYLVGLFVDIFNVLLADITFMFWTKVAFMPVAVFALGFSAASLMLSKYPPLPDLIFLRDLCDYKDWDIGRAKQIQDITFCLITLSLSLVYLKRIFGIGILTLISVYTVGKIIGFLKNYYAKKVDVIFIIGEDKFDKIMERNIFGASDIETNTGI